MKTKKFLRDSFYVNNQNFSGVDVNSIDNLIGGPWIHYTKFVDEYKLSLYTHTPISEEINNEIEIFISTSGNSSFSAMLTYTNINIDPLIAEWNHTSFDSYNNYIDMTYYPSHNFIDPGDYFIEFELVNENILNIVINSLDITGLTFPVFESLKYLDIQNNKNLTTLPIDFLTGNTSLISLNLHNNGLTDVPVFNNLNSLQSIDLSSNAIIELVHQEFLGMLSLTNLLLSDNLLTELNVDIFNFNPNLSYLSLNNNELSTLPVDVFDNLNNLSVLYLDNNKLNNLPDGVFNGLDNLNWLFLSYNLLSGLTPTIFDGLNKLHHLELINSELTIDDADNILIYFSEKDDVIVSNLTIDLSSNSGRSSASDVALSNLIDRNCAIII